MSDRSADPAIGVLEYGSISAGIVAGDAMVKSSPVGSIYAGSTHPGKYLVLVSGDTASVETSLQAGRDAAGVPPDDEVFLADVHADVAAAVVGDDSAASLAGEALGIVETATIPALLAAADAGVKAAPVRLAALRIADDLGGKGYLLFAGAVADVEASLERAVAAAGRRLVRSDLIAMLHAEMAANLESELRFMRRVVLRIKERAS
ncbi:MAG TPA: BMC domain-containing protein [Acidimicrobiia bacterium]